MQHIILIGGFGGSGKTTVSEMLFSHLDNAALVEEDHLFRIKPFGDWDQIGRIKTKNTHAMLRTFLEENISYVICSGYVWSQKELDGVAEEFANDGVKVWLFWLDTPKEVRHARAKKRAADDADSTPFLEQIEETFVKKVTLPITHPKAEWMQIDTTNKTPEQVTETILKTLK